MSLDANPPHESEGDSCRRSSKEFRQIYYPEPGPRLDYFDGSEPVTPADDSASAERTGQTLDEFARDLALLSS